MSGRTSGAQRGNRAAGGSPGKDNVEFENECDSKMQLIDGQITRMWHHILNIR